MAKGLAVWTVSRRIPKKIQRAVSKHARQIGEIAFSWNLLQDAFFELFWIVTTEHKPEKHPMVHAIWHSIQSDKTQREMLRDAAMAHDSLSVRYVGNIKWAIKKAAKLSEFRNDAVHTAVRFTISAGRTIPIPQHGSGRTQAVERLLANPTAKVWQRVRGDLSALANFCHALSTSYVAHGPRGPLPCRPRLLALPADKKKSHRKRKK